MKCSKCKKKAEYVINEKGKDIYLCKEHSRAKLIKDKLNFIPRIG